MSKATQKFKNTIIYKSYVSRKQDGAPATQEFRKGPRICFERGRLITEAYKETEGEPEVMRRAKALAKILGEMTIYIRDGERIVGNYASDPSSYNIFPELAVNWLNRAINNGYGDMVDEKGNEEWKEIYAYWKDRSMDGRFMAVVPDSIKNYVDFNGVSHMNHWRDYITSLEPNYKTLLSIGLNGVIDKIEKMLKELKSAINHHPKDYVNQRHFLEAAKIATQAVIGFANRYADEAEKMAQDENDSYRKRELEQIAETCRWVPANPPRTLNEALQSFWFIYLINRYIETHGQGLGERFDQLMYPFYKKEKAEGKITYEEAQELVEYFFVKIEECGHLVIPELHTGGVGVSTFQTFTIGGVDQYGNDASNEFSFIVIDAAIAMQTIHTNIAFRYHSKINPELVNKAIDCSRTGIGYPAYFNDSALMPQMIRRGIPQEDAMGYAILGCVDWLIPGKNMKQHPTTAGAISMGKCLELALNQGKDMLRGTKLGCDTPDPRTFKSIDDVMDAFVAQFRYVAQKVTSVDNLAHEFFVQYMKRPFTSALVDDCIERGQDTVDWAYHSRSVLLSAGNTNVADSLAAIKKFVFEDKVLTMDEMLDALRTNFEGKEDLRQRLLNQAPKFGNDDDYVDLIMADVQHLTEKEMEKIPDYYGNPWMLDGSIAGGYFPWGRRAAASADGRKAKDTFADAVLSPMHGRDRNGPTAVLKSLGKVRPTWSHLSNQKFLPQFLEGENKPLFASYLKTWADLGCSHIQFNVVDKETLLDAQAHPEKYLSLAVRVAGYSAFFVDLSKGVQDDIIARVSQRL